MRTFKLTLAYDGTGYSGWQSMPERHTVQGEIEAALRQITGVMPRVTGSGRTDSGVHALGQVASFDSETRLSAADLRRALNAVLPAEIRVLAAEEAREGFDACSDARRKLYRYRIHDGDVVAPFDRLYVWHLPRDLDVERMHRAAQHLVGTHDFRSFETHGPQRVSGVRTMFAVTVARGEGAARDLITVEVEGSGFLHHMVRAIVGTLARVGQGVEDEAWVSQVIAACDRSAAGMTAPPQGLFLVRVDYD